MSEITIENKTKASFATTVKNGEARNRVFVGGGSSVTVGKELSAGSYALLKGSEIFMKWIAAGNLKVTGDNLKDMKATKKFKAMDKMVNPPAEPEEKNPPAPSPAPVG